LKQFFLALLLPLFAAVGAQAESFQSCDAPGRPPTAEEQDLVLRIADVARREIERSGADVALVSRSGLNLSLLGQRYSHAGIAVADGPMGEWSVRQLYFSCDDGRPRIFDQGLAGFVQGMNDREEGHLSLVLLQSPELRAAATDRTLALALLSPNYSANAYAFALNYQNCNQWLAELMAAAWGGARDRSDAQGWLRSAGYEPTAIRVGPLAIFAPLSPWLHNDDREADDAEHGRYRVSLPPALEALARRQQPLAQRVEICHRGRQVVIRRGWEAMGKDCMAGPGDESLSLE